MAFLLLVTEFVMAFDLFCGIWYRNDDHLCTEMIPLV